MSFPYIACNDLLFGPNGNPYFPLFQSLEPHKVSKVNPNLLSDKDKFVVEWLRARSAIEYSALLENEDNPAGLQALLGTMPHKPQVTKTMDDVAMLKALRAREKKNKVAKKKDTASTRVQGGSKATEKQGVTSTGPQGGSSSMPPQKKARTEEVEHQTTLKQPTPPPTNNQGQPINPTPTSSFTPRSSNWWTLFTDFEENVVEKYLNKKEDRDRINKANLKAAEEEKVELLKEKTTWDEKFNTLEKGHQDLISEKETTIQNLLVEKTNLMTTNEKLKSDLVEARAEVAIQHTAGFEKALSHIQFLHPDLQIDDVGVFKHVVGGKLVDIVVNDDDEE
ncbi:hypothetical protein SESBI_38919 [Sesbania bispinosa]|nr:hypothetical protein SESBI_38919 [Sesbania bispinosa]